MGHTGPPPGKVEEKAAEGKPEVKKSTLNPFAKAFTLSAAAKEFVPSFGAPTAAAPPAATPPQGGPLQGLMGGAMGPGMVPGGNNGQGQQPVVVQLVVRCPVSLAPRRCSRLVTLHPLLRAVAQAAHVSDVPSVCLGRDSRA